MDSVLSLIGPAITAIEKMMGAWDAITGDLKAIQDFVSNRETKGTPALLKINQKIVIKKWNDLSEAGKTDEARSNHDFVLTPDSSQAIPVSCVRQRRRRTKHQRLCEPAEIGVSTKSDCLQHLCDPDWKLWNTLSKGGRRGRCWSPLVAVYQIRSDVYLV